VSLRILGFQSPPAWGYQVKDTEPKYQWFKLSLDPSWRNDSSNLVNKYPAPIAASFLDAKQTDNLVVKYLTALREHSERTLAQKFEEASNVLKRVDREYIITIPAVWSDAAKKRTRSCAEKAGLGVGDSLHVITEPEAAALYQLVHHVPSKLKTGDTFVLCDAGGG
jgi:molecular chaperone DnaK (HSP70)